MWKFGMWKFGMWKFGHDWMFGELMNSGPSETPRRF